MASPTREPTVLGLMMSSDRSTFVRCWPSTAGREDWLLLSASMLFVTWKMKRKREEMEDGAVCILENYIMYI